MIALSEAAAELRGAGVAGRERHAHAGGRETLYIGAVCSALVLLAVLLVILAIAAPANDGVHILGRALA